ncbi:MAG: hypothetical protein LRY73_10455 [Bacillus sp. (in: Bacteria)]|nr:hypothetical protein [Bacillus sp. (in: firmicutes)]
MKLLVIIALFTFLLTGCGDSEDDIISGLSIGGMMGNSFTLFVEDSLGGTRLTGGPFNFPIIEELDEGDYEVEAYKIQIKHDTLFINEETGEENYWYDIEDEVDWLFLGFGQKVRVHTVEEFEPFLSSNRPYIGWETALLPAFTAEKVYLQNPALSDILTIYAPLQEGNYQIMLVNSSTTDIYVQELDDYLEELMAIAPSHLNIEMMPFNNYFLLEMFGSDESDFEEVFFVLNSTGIALETENWDDVVNYFSE